MISIPRSLNYFGTLLRDEEKVGLEGKIDSLRRNAQVVEATAEAVLAAVKGNA